MQYILILNEENSHIHTIFSDKGWGSLMGERAKNRGYLDVDDRNKKKSKQKKQRTRGIMRTGGEKIKIQKFQAVLFASQ